MFSTSFFLALSPSPPLVRPPTFCSFFDDSNPPFLFSGQLLSQANVALLEAQIRGEEPERGEAAARRASLGEKAAAGFDDEQLKAMLASFCRFFFSKSS